MVAERGACSVTALSPYRTPSPPQRSPASSELVYRSRSPGGDFGLTLAAGRLWLIGALVAVVVSVARAPEIAALIVIIATLHGVRRGRRTGGARVVVLRVEGGILDVTARGPSATLLRE